MKFVDLGEIETLVKRTGDSPLRFLFFDARRGRLVASDGAVMAIVRVSAEGDERSGFIPADAIATAREKIVRGLSPDRVSIQVRGGQIQVLDKDTGVRILYPVPDLTSRDFPAYDSIIPKVSGQPTVVLNPENLLRLARALGHPRDGKNLSVALWLDADPMKPVLVKTNEDGPLGILATQKIRGEWKVTL